MRYHREPEAKRSSDHSSGVLIARAVQMEITPSLADLGCIGKTYLTTPSTINKIAMMTGTKMNSIHKWSTMRLAMCLASAETSVRGSNGTASNSWRRADNPLRLCGPDSFAFGPECLAFVPSFTQASSAYFRFITVRVRRPFLKFLDGCPGEPSLNAVPLVHVSSLGGY